MNPNLQSSLAAFREFLAMAVKHGIEHANAFEDPEGFDNFATLTKWRALWNEMASPFKVTYSTESVPAVSRPPIVCLCGSTRFFETFQEASLQETVAGKIVLSIGCNLRSDHQLWADPTERAAIKERLDELHKRKIDLANEVLVLNVGGYIGQSTRSEIDYALAHGKPVRYLEQNIQSP